MMKTAGLLAPHILHNKEKSTLFLPEFIRLNQPSDNKRFRTLLDLPGISVTDGMKGQLSELIKLRHPSETISTSEMDARIAAHLGDTAIEEYGVWVFYPWSNRLVHLLDKEEFIDVRTSRNTYKITPEERDLLATKKIGIIGLSVGQSVSVTLAMERVCGEIRLADFDLLELTNLNRIRTGVHNLGLPKVYSVAREIAEIDPYITVICFPEGLNENNLDAFFKDGGKLDLLVEESDGFDIKILSRYKARELGVPVIMEASDRCMVDVERFDLEPDRKILHGIVKHLDVDTLKTLKTNDDKIPYMLDILGFGKTTARLRASMLEMKQTVTTWPQLASAVTMGGGITADVSRRILLNSFRSSGRYYVDIDELIGDREKMPDPNPPPASSLTPAGLKTVACTAKNIDSAISESALKKVIDAALLAPSFENMQPWKWVVNKNVLYLFSDPAQALPASDPLGIAHHLSLGCAIENASQQAAAEGYELVPGYFPVQKEVSCVAQLAFRKLNDQRPHLAGEIKNRRTIRGAGKPFSSADKATYTIRGFENKSTGVGLHYSDNRQVIADITGIYAGQVRQRLLHDESHQEYFGRILKLGADRPKRGIHATDISTSPAHLLALEVIADRRVAALLRTWNKGGLFETVARSELANTMGAGLLTVSENSPQAMMEAGRMAERLWLHCCKNNLAFQPLFLPLTDTPVGTLFGLSEKQQPVLLFRVFDGEPPKQRAERVPAGELVFYC